ncbi:L-idonate 5-dehydrogenase [Rhodococcus opacus]|uniref:Zinc-binding alcohol dehydrogenase n=1 Tax=Rhodococcus opacus M213 TaxID=1129896 RepID=K8XIH8_RHOOP|nr:L-idonate 5-dehydrogenase [Rhodococcus opacus]ELB89153.1 zinc-binding alcohol dehydrogenase [Rhodococcus wratislaviensis IFP 2016]AHK35897.1 L-idonate 5-dehydrogenase [Rhodococcus opacus PD630]EKT81408.1 zinc-binding alcohol dehydrogenase [Rhodococcus opacus M213]UDH01372.1 L-idonate 5-dehydrogenase [Rhodococcus opacus PD630]WKN59961.1 L-idonate 5-dehydrogenase [Rhodococcus opacus]
MKALVVHGAGDLRFDELPAPSPEPGQVLVRNTHGGICGSDLHYYRHGAVGAFTLREPLVLGHEVVGRIENDPSGTLPTGTAVAIHPASPCGQCPECGAGVRNVCRNARYFGSAASCPHTQGGFSEYMTVRQDQIRVLPATLPLSRAVLAEPLAVGLHALSRAGGVAGAKVLVCGSGPIGILAAGAAKAAGAEEVWTTDLLEHPLKIALDVGVDRTVRIGNESLPDQYFDVAIEASGASVAVGPTLAAVRRRGVMVQLGMFAPGPRPAELSALVAKEIDFRGAFRFDTEFDDAIALLAGTDVLDPVITHTFDLTDAVAAMDVAADPGSSGKVVLRLSDR